MGDEILRPLENGGVTSLALEHTHLCTEGAAAHGVDVLIYHRCVYSFPLIARLIKIRRPDWRAAFVCHCHQCMGDSLVPLQE